MDERVHRVVGWIAFLSGIFVAVPQLLNWLVRLGTFGWRTGIPFFDTLTHFGGVLFGSLMIPTYKQYYELQIPGVLLIAAAVFGAKAGWDIIHTRSGAYHSLMYAEIGSLVGLIAVLYFWSAPDIFRPDIMISTLSGILPVLITLGYASIRIHSTSEI